MAAGRSGGGDGVMRRVAQALGCLGRGERRGGGLQAPGAGGGAGIELQYVWMLLDHVADQAGLALRRSREVGRVGSAGVTQVRNAQESVDQERDREQDVVIARCSREVDQS